MKTLKSGMTHCKVELPSPEYKVTDGPSLLSR